MPETELKYYMSDISKYEVKYDSNTKFLYGLPIMKVGTYNNISYTKADFNTMVNNFNYMRTQQDFEPSMKPQHTFDSLMGLPENFDVRDNILGYIKNLYVSNDTLIADIQLTDESEVIPHMINKKIRYFSTEIYPNYTTSLDSENEKELGMVLVAVSAVANPAVKNMPFDLIINSEDFETQNNSIEGGNNMGNLWEQLKSALSSSEVEEIEEEVEEEPTQTFEEGETDETEVNEEETEEVEVNEEKTEEETNEIETNQEEDIAEKYEEQLSEKDKKIEELEKAAMNKDIEDVVGKLTREGYLKPANKDKVRGYLTKIYSDEEARDNFIEILKENSDIPNKNKNSVEFEGSVQINDELSDEEAESYAEKVMKE